MVFEKSKWIWLKEEYRDQYAEFFDKTVYTGGDAIINISCSNDYALFINGVYAASNQYGDYEHYKIYDTVDITHLLKKGGNEIKILVYYCGEETSRHCLANAGLIYEMITDGVCVGFSSENTASRLSPVYESGLGVLVSSQLGHTFSYDATKEDSPFPCTSSSLVKKECNFFPRPIKKQRICEQRKIKFLTPESGTRILVDLSGETVGLPTLELYSDTEQTLTVAWGEHIRDGCVRKEIGSRNFYFKYKTKKGKNSFTEYMLRLGCRYIEIYADEPIKVSYVGILPQVYDVRSLDKKTDEAVEQRIYDICINTLRMCMMEHYVDCPWREQALYAFDSRNQMLFGYYAFENGNREYARANLKLIGMDRREDKILSICHPCSTELAIPSFSLYYIFAVREYTEHTGDASLANEVFEKICDILGAFLPHIKNGLACRFGGKLMWNFYDWSDFSAGTLRQAESEIPDLIINCLLITAFEHFGYICDVLGKKSPYVSTIEVLKKNIKEAFLDKNGLFTMHAGECEYTVLGNSLALLANVPDSTEAKLICEKLTDGTLSDCSLSMKIFQYDALIKTDKEKYASFIRNDIKRNYEVMLDYGSDTVWETMGGPNKFGGACSLCHGWSAVPVYIYHKLGIIK